MREDREFEEFRNLMKAPDQFEEGISWGTVLMGLFVGLVMAPANVYMSLVAGLHMVKKGGKEPDGDLAWDVIYNCYLRGLLMFAPVGFGGATVKIAPPLCLTEEAALEGVAVIRESLEAALA